MAVLDDSSESMYEDLASLVESPSVLDCGDVNDININLDLTIVQQSHVREIISDYSKTFTTRPGCTTLIEHDIRLMTDTSVRVKQYPLLFSTVETIKGEIKGMIDLNIDELPDRSYCSPVLIGKKKDNSYRFRIDFFVHLVKSQSLMRNQCPILRKYLQK